MGEEPGLTEAMMVLSNDDPELKKLRWGVLGTARTAGKRMLPAMLRAGHRIVAIAGRNEQRLSEFKDRFQIPRVYGWNEAEKLIANQEVDAVYIPLPSALHAEWVLRSLEGDKHVLCEKPIALHPADVDNIQVGAELSAKTVAENFSYHLTPGYRHLEQLRRRGELAKLEFIIVRHHFRARPEHNVRYDRDLGGGSFVDLGCYGVDFVHRFLNESVQVVGIHKFPPPDAQRFWGTGPSEPVDARCEFLGVTKSGVRVSITTSFLEDPEQYIELALIDGTIFKLHQAFRVENTTSMVIRSFPDGRTSEEAFGTFDADLQMLSSFTECLRNPAFVKEQFQRWRLNASILERVINSA